MVRGGRIIRREMRCIYKGTSVKYRTDGGNFWCVDGGCSLCGRGRKLFVGVFVCGKLGNILSCLLSVVVASMMTMDTGGGLWWDL